MNGNNAHIRYPLWLQQAEKEIAVLESFGADKASFLHIVSDMLDEKLKPLEEQITQMQQEIETLKYQSIM